MSKVSVERWLACWIMKASSTGWRRSVRFSPALDGGADPLCRPGYRRLACLGIVGRSALEGSIEAQTALRYIHPSRGGVDGVERTVVSARQFELFSWVINSRRSTEEFMTMMFVALVLIQFFNTYLFQSDHHSFLDKPFC